MTNRKLHEGRNVKHFREMLGIKQDALAYELGKDWNQKKISLLEQKEALEPALLKQLILDIQGLINDNPTFNIILFSKLSQFHKERIYFMNRG